ncbi:DUF4931 domain-containing protein [Cytobacillus suaedae]|nr:DUF4931 domain-containing protein [Cytobacillus suaedae]
MNPISPLVFDLSIGRQKPESIRNRSAACPFCDRDNLENILAEEGSIMLLMNKYPTLENTFQTVLIETDNCDDEFSTYPKEHIENLIRFAIKHWYEMIDSGKFESVLLFKNYGPFSGGSIHHAHMQIVGLEDHDYTKHVSLDQFEGIEIHKTNSVEFTISTKPRMGFFEFNICMENLEDINIMTHYLQNATHFVLHHFSANCNSYNIFFYNIEEKIYVKVIPRFATSPLFVGYSIPQVARNIDEVAEKVRKIYFNK